jgi:hypothetical protein
MSAEHLLEKLAGVRSMGGGRYMARCPVHGDRHASLAIKFTSDGVVLLYCHAGCGTCDILDKLGMNYADLYPKTSMTDGHARKPLKRPFDANQVLAALVGEALTIIQICRSASLGNRLSDAEHARLILATQRFMAGLDKTNG